MPSTLADLVNQAQVFAIQKLTTLLQSCDDPAEVRRIRRHILAVRQTRLDYPVLAAAVCRRLGVPV